MKILLILFLPILAYGQSIPYTLDLVEIKPDTEIKIPFNGKGPWKEIVVHRTNYDTTASYELVVTLKKKTTTHTPVIIEQIVDAEQATFSSNWTYHGSTTATGWLNNTISFSNAPGSTVTYTFTGRKIEVYGETLLNHGTGTIKVDNEPEVAVTYKSATKVLPAKIFEKSWPTDGQHTIVVKVGTGNNLVDYFRILRAQ